ncbi:uncharacterized protein LOC117170938 [Belonocnema kinseyi]|uniref:uncharacterized protein LOC117170938 n=1 Tax=Belonocnema kinseyi TaxID=2817044 RepID=UPI00143D7509|nr:uncharacterized protein LOC117170938 [Belonocnema kinseyi]
MSIQSPSAGEIVTLPCDGDPSPVSNDEAILFPEEQEKSKREKRETSKPLTKEVHSLQKESEFTAATFNAKTDCLNTKWERENSKDNKKKDSKTPSKSNQHRKPNRRKKRASQTFTDRENLKSATRNKETANSSSSEASNDVLEEAACLERVKRQSKARFVGKDLDLDSSDVSDNLDLELPKTKKYLWFSKNSKNHLTKGLCQITKVAQDKSKTVRSLKVKKTTTSCSPHKKFSRSSLRIESDKITINLSKYSPCASRLAASSKILSTESVSNSESPLHVVHSRSPSHVNVQQANSLPLDKMSIQASLSLNTHQFEKTRRSTSRSRSVGDSCVTSPTSEGTTLSYSPTVTEILSLEEVIPQILVTEDSPSYQHPDVKRESEKRKKAATGKEATTLETKC